MGRADARVACIAAGSRRYAVVALELGRITAGFGFGFGYTVAVYFARTQPPSRTVLRAGRLTTRCAWWA